MAGSRAEERIKRLEEQLGGKILMHEITADTINTEDLIAQVASREINYTIADADLAKLSKTYYPQLASRWRLALHSVFAGLSLPRLLDSLMPWIRWARISPRPRLP